MNWPWIFYINIPVGLLGIFMVTRFVHEPEDIRRANRERAAEQRKNLDWQGVLLMTFGLAALQYVLEEGSRNDWFSSMPVAICTFLAIFLLAAFVIRELTAPVPAVDLSLFKDKVFLSGTIIGSIMFSVLMSITFLLPLFMQQLLGFSAVQAGLALMPRALAMMVAIPLGGAALQLRAAAHHGDDRRRAGGAQRLRDVALHARHQQPLGGRRHHPAGVRLRV